MAIIVRPATAADLTFVSQDAHLPPAVILRKIRSAEVLVAESDLEPVGYARFEYLWSRVPYLTLIWVLPAHRRRGVGAAILAFLEGSLRRAGYPVLWSSATAGELEPQAWHLRMGFLASGRLEELNADGKAEVFFRKSLGN